MTYSPASLQALGKLWVAEGGRNLGIVGDTSHAAKGGSYHLGADQLLSGAYSNITKRDRDGLTNAASAIDLGRLDGSLHKLREFSVWLVGQARANAPGTSDIREIIYTDDGKRVLRWDRQRGYKSAPRTGEADSSHLTHTHISWYRDAEERDHTTAFRPYFGLPDTATEEATVRSFLVTETPQLAVIRAGAWLYDAYHEEGEHFRPSPGNVQLSPNRPLFYVGHYDEARIVAYEPATPDAGLTSKTYFVPAADVTSFKPYPVPVPDCKAAIAAAISADRAKARITYP